MRKVRVVVLGQMRLIWWEGGRGRRQTLWEELKRAPAQFHWTHQTEDERSVKEKSQRLNHYAKENAHSYREDEDAQVKRERKEKGRSTALWSMMWRQQITQASKRRIPCQTQGVWTKLATTTTELKGCKKQRSAIFANVLTTLSSQVKCDTRWRRTNLCSTILPLRDKVMMNYVWESDVGRGGVFFMNYSSNGVLFFKVRLRFSLAVSTENHVCHCIAWPNEERHRRWQSSATGDSWDCEAASWELDGRKSISVFPFVFSLLVALSI